MDHAIEQNQRLASPALTHCQEVRRQSAIKASAIPTHSPGPKSTGPVRDGGIGDRRLPVLGVPRRAQPLCRGLLAAAVSANGAVVADAFTVFLHGAAVAGGKTCFAGFLNADPANQLACDVPPSIYRPALAGQDRCRRHIASCAAVTIE